MCWPPIRAGEFEAELGGDNNLVPDRLQRFPDDVLVGERAVDLCRVEEGHAALVRRPNERNGILRVGRRSIAVAEAHASEAERRYLECSDGAFFHSHLLDQAAHSVGATSSWD
jgi:hypothetical protein